MLSLVETEGLSWDPSFHQRYTKAPNPEARHEPLPPSSLALSRARSTSGLAEGQKTTYGRSSLKPTVGRLTDLPWVAKATYRRSFFTPSAGRSFEPRTEGEERLLQEADLLLETLELVAQAGRFDEV